MNEELRALAAEFKAFLPSREEDDLTPAACTPAAARVSEAEEKEPAALSASPRSAKETPAYSAAEDTAPQAASAALHSAPSATAQAQPPQDHLTIEFVRQAKQAAAHAEQAVSKSNAPLEKSAPQTTASAAAGAQPVFAASAQSQQTEEPFFQAAPAAHSPTQEDPVTPQEKQAVLDQIAEEIKTCRRCPLGQTRLNAVPGEGNPAAELMFIGEGPGFDEDHQGRPFIGRAGQLLDKMIAAMGLKREQVFIGNIAKCHPMVNPADPEARGNDRAPNAGEIAVCRKYIERQIAAISPKYVVALGGVAAKALISDTKSLGALRGKFHLLHLDTVELKTPVKILATYHPAALLRNPAWKKDAWADLQMVMAEMGLKRPQG